jgi:hypothetical protein
LRVVERIGVKPCRECGTVFVTKTTFKKLRRLLLAAELGSEPAVKGIAIIDPLLSCQSGKAFSGNSEPARFGVLRRTFSSP